MNSYPPAPSWQITDEALAILDRELATPAPERGAALLAPADSRIVVDVLVDPVPGEHANYWHSATLGKLLNERLMANPLLRYVGTTHSHPSGMAWPSEPDHEAFAASVEASGLEAGLFPIVVQQAPEELRMPAVYGAGHLVHLPHGTFAPYTWRAQRGLDPCHVSVLPLRGPLETAIAAVADRAELRLGRTEPVAGVGTSWLLVPVEGPVRLDVLVPQSYPESAPLIRTNNGVFVSRRWNLAQSLAERWETALRDSLGSASPAPSGVRAGLETRLRHHLPPAVARVPRRVAILGCGSVGSNIAEQLVRSGVKEFTLVDPDVVGAENLSRTVYAAGDLGLPKVEALGRRLTAIAPDVTVTSVPEVLGSSAAAVLADVDLAVMASDDPNAEAWHSHVLYDAGTPHVSAKLFARAEAGEITVVVPAAGTACLSCATGMVVGTARQAGTNYGSGRLEAEPALGPDIVAVSARAARTALAVLHRGEPGPLADWVRPLLDAGRTLNLSCSVAGWGVFEQVALAPMDGPFASLWVQTSPQPSCPVCGADRVAPVAPLDEVVLPDDLDALLLELGSEDPDRDEGAGERLLPVEPVNER